MATSVSDLILLFHLVTAANDIVQRGRILVSKTSDVGSSPTDLLVLLVLLVLCFAPGSDLVEVIAHPFHLVE